MGRQLEKSSGTFVSDYTQNSSELNTSRFNCRCIYTTPGTYTFTVPSGVCSITAVAVGPGGCANCVVKLGEKYIYKICESICNNRCQVICNSTSPYPCSGFGYDCVGLLLNCTFYCTSFRLGGFVSCSNVGQNNCFRSNYDSVYSQIDYAVIDSGPGGGYSEKQITTTPGSTFCIVVGVNTGNNFSCINGQICATGPCIQNGTGISTVTQYTCSCCCVCETYCCISNNTCYRSESYSKCGPVCYIKEKQINSCLVPGCGYGGTTNRSGGFGCNVKSFCFPLGFDDLNYDQCSCVAICSPLCGANPFLCVARNISLCTSIVLDPSTGSMAVCPSDLVANHTCYFPQCAFRYSCPGCTLWYCRGGEVRRNCLNYCDTITRCTIGCAGCTWNPMSYFLIPSCYCGVCFSNCCSNFIGIVTDISNINCLSVLCNMGGGSSGGSPCYNGVYQSGICQCELIRSTEDRPTITSCAGGRPVFSDGSCYFACPIEMRVYSTYDPTSTDLGYSRFALVTNTGCNPCNCRDIGCFFCTCRFDIIKNMWGIVSGPQCFSFGATGIGNSLTLCDPLRFARSAGSCVGHVYCFPNTGCSGFCSGCCQGCVSYYGTCYCALPTLWRTLSGGSSCGRSESTCTLVCSCNLIQSCFSVCSCAFGGGYGGYTISYPATTYWPTCTCYSSTGGVCTGGIPVFNIYELFCDSSGKCVNFCCLCTDAGKQFHTSLGESGLDVLRLHFSPCACSGKCFGSYNNWPCYFASVGVGTTIPCGGNSPLLPRQELTVCDPRYIPNNYHSINVQLTYCLGCASCIWGGGSNCIFCNSFASATSNLCRGYKLGIESDAGAGTGYTGSGRNCTCCYSYTIAATSWAAAPCTGGVCCCTQCLTECFTVTDYGGGGGHYSSNCPTKITCFGRCSFIILTPSGGKGWGDYDTALITSNSSENKLNPPSKEPKLTTWFDTRQAKGSGATGPICVGGVCYPAVKAGPGGGGIGGFGNEYASTCVFGGAVCSGTAGPGGGAGGQGVPGTGMVVIYWNP